MWILGWALIATASPCSLAVENGRIPAAEKAILFATAKPDLVGDSAAAIEGIACVMTEDRSLKLYIGIHTDSTGMDAYNLRISQDRANAVRDALGTHGVTPDRIVAAGYGETYPIATNATAEGRAENRRVELSFSPLPVPLPLPPSPVPVPVPVPIAEPPPTPRADPCTPWLAIGKLLPWSGCTGITTHWECHRPESAAVLAAVATQCLGIAALVDGKSVYLGLSAGTVSFIPEGKGAIVRWSAPENSHGQ